MNLPFIHGLLNIYEWHNLEKDWGLLRGDIQRMKIKHNVQMKGTKEGLVLYLDDQCSYDDLKKDLNERLAEKIPITDHSHLIPVKLHIGNRFLTDEQIEEISQIVEHKQRLIIESIQSNVVSKEEAEKMRAENSIVSIARIVRSGQVIEVPGDLLLIGDVNPGGKVVAGGSIFIMGVLKGIAHAGCYGDTNAIISASIMMPTQIRIHEYIWKAPDEVEENRERKYVECAYISDNNEIVIDRLQTLMMLRPNLKRLIEGGL